MEDDLYTEIKNYANQLMSNGKISSKESYECLLSSLRRFHKKDKLSFYEITVQFLENYEKWMITKGRKDGKPQRSAGVGIYMRNLRCIMNLALTNKIISKDDYPFEKDKYQPPVGTNVKKALTITQLRNIQNYQFEKNTTEMRSRDLWLFSYFSNGMNFKDICQLTWGDINGDVFHFTRAKTINTRKQPKMIRVILMEQTIEIINRWGNPSKEKDSYVFDFLKVGMTPMNARYCIQSLVKRINKDMKFLAVKLNIETNLTTYVARHSYASQLLRSNAPAKLISDGLGHANLVTTQNYLADFDEVTQRKFANSLL